ncbi:hypothetical protein A2973_05520 [Candidatus Gottesmanbacteria bacterium RIFCSPLOWO2_01_FULL_49_10]|uniref:Bacterial Ig domain-containing protein n=1 Tax=Candidatus Gottesmanbacteria bacterium RIFCSPLOWO2_01_FULL_49_10 TaxID=1798396 RepID=A0A1F6B1F2_9BACT|nr:MAG: hypothetical protein UY10_C0001G0007 [Microgenomates group bacterium GW2011_GWA2_47_8]OGG30633.1 MAG: hypothetical protein A2973_05520 [Candidatus Gottesmanbacteria bacterium RIFCSPLOWO2_01_FULL_49_10]
MNKDALLATGIGLGLGLLIAVLFIFGPGLATSITKIKLPQINFSRRTTTQQTPTPDQKKQELTLVVSAPLDQAIEPTKDVVVSGVTVPGATVVIQGSNDDDVATADSEGKYAGKITVSEGKNDITVTAYSDQKQLTQSLSVYFTEEKF